MLRFQNLIFQKKKKELIKKNSIELHIYIYIYLIVEKLWVKYPTQMEDISPGP